ncbi:MAG: hypothetical protein JNM78_13715 [Cyclobacteriaceae bacterium]|nr:hypothetical protein [Cyclobacteriaceae bacterium]
MKKYLVLLLFIIPCLLQGQKHEVSNLFLNEKSLDLKLAISIKGVKAITSDTVYSPAIMHFNAGDGWDSIAISVRARGNFRRKECYYPPLKIKIRKEDAKGTVFEGNKSLKLVLPCNQSKDNALIMKEYIAYQMYEGITEYTFNTRLLTIEFTDLMGKKSKSSTITGFFIEDDDIVAKRHNGKVVEDLKLHPKLLEEKNSIRHDLFQYMIANTDWSTTFLHNAKMIQLNESNEYIPLAYDFDMAGFVDAPYAQVNEALGIANVRERLFRGFCRSEDTFQSVRNEFIANEDTIKSILMRYQSAFDVKAFTGMTKYIDEFFETMKSDKKFKTEITDKCRTK